MRRVRCVELGIVFESTRSAAEWADGVKTRSTQTSIQNAASGKRPGACGLSWEFVYGVDASVSPPSFGSAVVAEAIERRATIILSSRKPSPMRRRVRCIENRWVFESVAAAIKWAGTGVEKSLRGGGPARGHTFEYTTDAVTVISDVPCLPIGRHGCLAYQPLLATSVPPRNVPGIYRIISPSGKQYIGSSAAVLARWSKHRRDLLAGNHHCRGLQNACDKYGLNSLRFDLLCEAPKSDLIELEQLVFDIARPQYNSTYSAENVLGDLWARPEFRSAASSRSSERAKLMMQDPEKVKNFRAGAARHLTELHRNPEFAAAHAQRASTRLRTVVHTPEVQARAAESRRSVMQKTRETIIKKQGRPLLCLETGQVFACAADAANSCGCKQRSNFSQAASGKRKSAGGFTWRYADAGEASNG